MLSMILSACEQNTDNWDNFCSDLEIEYFQGSGWTGWKFYTTIDFPDSLFIYEKHYIPFSYERRSKYLIDNNESDSLLQDLNKLRQINLKNYYGFGPDKMTDLPGTFFKFKNCNTSDSASIYSPVENEIPDELTNLLGRINRIVIHHDTLLTVINKIPVMTRKTK